MTLLEQDLTARLDEHFLVALEESRRQMRKAEAVARIHAEEVQARIRRIREARNAR